MQTQSLLYRPNHSNITTKKSFSQEVRPQLAYPMLTFASSKHLNLLYDGTENKRRFHA